jgi:Domain of unknown function (DUF222)/HNH endonuclease
VSGEVEEAVRSIRAGLDALLSVDFTGLSAEGLTELTRGFETQARRVPAVQHRLVAEVEQRQVGFASGVRSTAGFLSAQLRLSPREAAGRVRAAADRGPRRDLAGQPLPPLHPHLAQAERDGAVSAGQVRVITAALADLSPDADRDHGARLEQDLVTDAARFDPQQLTTIARHRLAHVDPDGIEPADRAQQRRRAVRHVVNTDGSADWSMRLTAAAHATWVTILDALAAPTPAEDGVRDPRSTTQRRHDALLAAGQRLLRAGDLPASGGIPVTILITLTADQLTDQLTDQAGYATTQHGDPISIPALLQLATEADLIPTVLSSTGAVLHYGRTRRLASPAQRLALAARDGGCCFPGCTMPITWTEAHHVTPWAAGGRTDLANLAPLCRHHHDHHQQQGWDLTMTDAVPWWRPPRWIDPERQPIRNTTRHQDPLHAARQHAARSRELSPAGRS